ncbi:MAG: hypothetical protein MI863_07655 [Desulfobacterales bacterium]|nr:hypothetical protein [Desulfobacterales bacterium]
MKRFGNDMVNPEAEMDALHLFRMRLHLLIIMVKARLEGYPVGRFRKEAVLENASLLHQETLRIDIRLPGSKSSNHLLKERVKLLSVMATAMISDEYPLGVHRRAAVLDNIESIVATVFPKQDFTLFHDILKAA